MTPDPIKSRMKGVFSLHRAWRLVWSAAPRWASVSLLLILAQATLPLLALVLLKQIVDALGSALAAPDESSFSSVALWIGLAGVVALVTALVNAFSSYVAEAQALAVTDHVSDVVHAKSIAVDLGYYEDPSFHDTLHLVEADTSEFLSSHRHCRPPFQFPLGRWIGIAVCGTASRNDSSDLCPSTLWLRAEPCPVGATGLVLPLDNDQP